MTVDSPHDRRFQFPTPPPDSDSYKHSGHTPNAHRSRASSRTRNDVSPPPELSEQRRTPRLAAGWRPEAEAGPGDEDRSNGKESLASARTLSSGELVELLSASPTFVPPSEVTQPETPGRHRAASTSDSVQSLTPTILEAPMSRTMSTPPGARRRENSRVLKSPLEIVKDGADDRHPIVHQSLEFPRRMPGAVSSGSNGTELAMGEVVDEMTPSRKARLRQSNPPLSATLPPLPFHSYLSLTLGSPTSITPNRSSPLAREGAESTTQVYGVPPHHPDDSGAIALERILNFLMLPPKLEGALMFGLFACLDSWLYIFTILPLRFLKALGVLIGYWNNCIVEYFTYEGKKLQKTRRKSIAASSDKTNDPNAKSKRKKDTKLASDLMPSHKADIMRGMVLFTTCWVLMRFDASKMYHSVRGQSGIKLYVIYNMLDVGDQCSSLPCSY